MCFHSDGTVHDFNEFKDIKQLGSDIFYVNISIKEVKDEQDEMKKEIIDLESYNPINEKRIKSREEIAINAKKLRHLKMVFFHCLKKICIKNRLKKKKKKKKRKKKQFLIGKRWEVINLKE